MRKEVILAVILGLLLGSALVYGLYTANKSVKSPEPTQDETMPTPTPEVSLLTLVSPADGDVIEKDNVILTGSVQQNTVLLVLTEDDEIIVEPEEDGSFELEIELIPGGNLIQISAISQTGRRQDEYLNLAFIKPEESDSSDDTDQSSPTNDEE